MMTLLLAPGCSGGAKGTTAEQLALEIRGDYLAAREISAQAVLTADYGQRVYEYTMDIHLDPEVTTLTITAPEHAAGICARLEQELGTLTYQELSVETGPLDPQGLTPVCAVPALIEAARSGYITACSLEDPGTLRVDCGQPDQPPGSGREIVLWFSPDTAALLGGEILVDGFRCISCRFTQFTKES